MIINYNSTEDNRHLDIKPAGFRDICKTQGELSRELHPTAIIEACGGQEAFNKFKILDYYLLEPWEGAVIDKDAVTEPVMIGVNYYNRAFIVITFDVYDAEGTKIAEKISQVFHDSIYDYEICGEIKNWQGYTQIYGFINITGKTVLELAEYIQTLLNGNFIEDPHRFNPGTISFLKLWKRDMQ